MVELNLKNIYKKYPNSEHYSVEDFNLDIKDKEFIVFVGPSGCGKSTTLRMIAGLEDITEGECSIDSRVVNDVAPKDRDIAMVFQNYALYPHMTVHDNMAFGLKLRKYSKDDIEKRVNEAAEILGLKEFLDRKPADLSGGQRQRVAMGRAIVRDAKVFLMDEPLSKEELDTSIDLNKEPLFLFNNGIIMIGKPILQNIRGYENTYRIPVNGLDENTIYSISYGKNKPKTFKTYTTEKEITDKYRNRYGDYF